jgi:hypothetical protein
LTTRERKNKLTVSKSNYWVAIYYVNCSGRYRITSLANCHPLFLYCAFFVEDGARVFVFYCFLRGASLVNAIKENESKSSKIIIMHIYTLCTKVFVYGAARVKSLTDKCNVAWRFVYLLVYRECRKGEKHCNWLVVYSRWGRYL